MPSLGRRWSWKGAAAAAAAVQVPHVCSGRLGRRPNVWPCLLCRRRLGKREVDNIARQISSNHRVMGDRLRREGEPPPPPPTRGKTDAMPAGGALGGIRGRPLVWALGGRGPLPACTDRIDLSRQQQVGNRRRRVTATVCLGANADSRFCK